MDSKSPLSRPHKVTGLIQFSTTKDEFLKLAGRFISDVKTNPDRQYPIEFDKIVVLGTVGGQDIFQIRFIKFTDNEQPNIKDDTSTDEEKK